MSMIKGEILKKKNHFLQLLLRVCQGVFYIEIESYL